MTAQIIPINRPINPLRRIGELTPERADQLIREAKWQATITIVNHKGRAELLDYLFNGLDEFYCTLIEGRLGGEIEEMTVRRNPLYQPHEGGET
jgi:hypothetical protein